MPSADEGAVAPGLGNFKGVMLCNRPDLAATKTKDPTELPPFYSHTHPGSLEPMGMLHPTDMDPRKAKVEAPVAMVKHRKWLAHLAEELKVSKADLATKDKKEEAKFYENRERCADQRAAVREALRNAEDTQQSKNDPGLIIGLRDAIAVSEKPRSLSPMKKTEKKADTATSPTSKSAPVKEGDHEATAMTTGSTVMAKAASDVATSTVSAGKKKPGKSSLKKSKKPLWAMSEAEKEQSEEKELAELVDFAHNLNFEEYVEDLEFRQALSVLKGRAHDLIARTEAKFKREMAEKKEDLITEVTAENLSELEDRSGGNKVKVDVVSGVSQSVSQRGARPLPAEEDEASSYYSTEKSSEETASSVSSLSSYHELRRKKAELIKQAQELEAAERELAAHDKDDDAVSAVSSSREQAKAILKKEPEIRAVHSKESLARILEKAEALAKGLEEMSKMPANRQPLIVVSDDHHPVGKDLLDPKSLAYLYRSPAI
ncbi:unnamed protein product [Amoebophrya sp. A25]|nr:unnamed protein product [Amoebophrya sp. A25]|eukprot:GSA25T00015987001.1